MLAKERYQALTRPVRRSFTPMTSSHLTNFTIRHRVTCAQSEPFDRWIERHCGWWRIGCRRLWLAAVTWRHGVIAPLNCKLCVSVVNCGCGSCSSLLILDWWTRVLFSFKSILTSKDFQFQLFVSFEFFQLILASSIQEHPSHVVWRQTFVFWFLDSLVRGSSCFERFQSEF